MVLTYQRQMCLCHCLSSTNDDEALIQQMLSGDDHLLFQMKICGLMAMPVTTPLRQV